VGSGGGYVLRRGLYAAGLAFLLSASLGSAEPALEASKSRIEAALQNIVALDRPGQNGYATVSDGNKYVQCGLLRGRVLRCEAAGSAMQPSLDRVLTPERVGRLTALGWHLDPSFGNYAQTFPADIAANTLAERIVQVLVEVYAAQVTNLQVQTAWIKSEPCPPRNGPTQNLAGIVNDALSMAATAVHACAYKPKPNLAPGRPAGSTAELFDFYGARVTGEIGRLRVNIDRRVFAIFQAGIGYVQCEPDASPPAIYCEAQSADSWEALASVLTPDRIAILHAAGYADPGRAPNYWKKYAADRFDNLAIAREVLAILHDVYGYNGLPALEVLTEDSRQ